MRGYRTLIAGMTGIVAITVLAIHDILLNHERLVVNYLLVASTVLAIPAILLTQERLVVDSIVERLIA